MKRVNQFLLCALMTFSAIACDKFQSPAKDNDARIGAYSMTDISASRILDMNKDGLGSTDALDEFYNIPGFYVPMNTADVVTDPYNTTENDPCYFVNAKIPYPKYSNPNTDSVVEAVEYFPVSIRVAFYGNRLYTNEIKPSISSTSGLNINKIRVYELDKGMLCMSLEYTIDDKTIDLRYYYHKN